MKDLEVVIKTVVEGLRSIAQGVEKIAEKLEESAPKKQPTAKRKPARKTKTEPAPAAKAATKPKKAPAKKAPAKKKATAADTVLAIINISKKGVDSATLAEKTGYDKKKIANLVFKLRKLGKIKSVSKGIYTKA
jgi:predicted Rossmann fold nucleotide-binding protein DprA/Smf involved in DNA uptake